MRWKLLSVAVLSLLLVLVMGAFPSSLTLAQDTPKGSLAIKEIIVDPPEAGQGTPVNVTVKLSYSATPTPSPWQLIFKGTLAMDEEWLAQNPGTHHVQQVVTIPGPGYIHPYTSIHCYRLDDPSGSCDYKGDYRASVFDSKGEAKHPSEWVDGGTVYLIVNECLSSDLDRLPYACDIEVYWEPDTDVGEAPEACYIQVTASPEIISPGERALINVRVTDGEGQPVPGAAVEFDIVGGPGMVAGGNRTTDAQGRMSFEYVSPEDVGGATSATIAVTVEGCPGMTTVAVNFGTPLTPTDTPISTPVSTPTPTPTVPPSTPTATPPSEAHLELEVDDSNPLGLRYKSIAADEISKLRLVARVSGALKPQDVSWKMRAEGVENPGSLEVAYAAVPNASVRDFFPPLVFKQPFIVRITAKAQAPDGRVLSDFIDIQVVRPPVVLIHGIWSNRGAMVPVGVYLHRTGQFRIISVDYGLPPRKSHDDMRKSVRYLAEGVERILTKLNGEGVKVSRVDIVAHSMGGLISRLYIVGDGQSIPAHPDKVRKLITLGTPHGGSPVADWYTDLMDNGSVDCSDPSGYVYDKVTRGEMKWLIGFIRWWEGLGPDALEFGQAVRQLQTKGHPGSIVDVITARQGQVNDRTSYHIIVGDKAFIGAFGKKTAYAALKNLYADYLDPCGAGWRPAVESMINSFLDLISGENSDGVVTKDSALARGTGIQPETVDRALGADHFGLPGNGYALSSILSILTYGQVRLGSGTFVISHSPGYLHVYDAAGRHVGLDSAGQPELGIEGAVYEPFSDTAGDHELIWVPQAEGITIQFLADREGMAGIDISQSYPDGLQWFSYEDIEVEPGSEIAVQLSSSGPEGYLTQPDGESVSISPAHSEILFVREPPTPSIPAFSGSSGTSVQSPGGFEPLWSLLLLAICGLVLTGGGIVVMLFLASRHSFAKWALGGLIPLALLLAVVSCLLGWATLSGGQETPVVEETAPSVPLATGVVQPTATSVPIALPPTATPTVEEIAPPVPSATEVVQPTATPVPVVPSPTATPVPVAPSPTATPTVEPAEPFIGPITFAEGIDEDGKAINPADSFPEGIKKVYALAEYGNMNPEVEFAYQWVVNGEVVIEDSGPWLDEEEAGVYSDNIFLEDGSPLPPGTYELRFYIGGELVQSASFTVVAASP